MFAEIIIAGACSFFHLGANAAINPHAGPDYVACRWDYSAIAKEHGIKRNRVKAALKNAVAIVRNKRTGKTAKAKVADWGPARWTGRHADLSPRLMKTLNLSTDDMVEVRVKLMGGNND